MSYFAFAICDKKNIVFSYPLGECPYDVFAVLWALGAAINATDRHGNTPLHIATELYRCTGIYPYDCKNHGEHEVLSRIITRLVTIFDADPAVKNHQGLSVNDLIANAPPEPRHLASLANLLAETKMAKLMREFSAGELSLEDSICAAQKLGCLMPIAEYLYGLKNYSAAYQVYQLIENQNSNYVLANGRIVDILLSVGPEGYAQFPSQEKQSYEEALFTASLQGRRTDLAMELYQAKHQQTLSLEAENSHLKQELNALRQPKEMLSASSDFWYNPKESEDEVASTPRPLSRSLG